MAKGQGLIVDIRHRGKQIEVYKIASTGRFIIFVDNEVVQKDLDADAALRWMGHAMHEEPRIAHVEEK